MIAEMALEIGAMGQDLEYSYGNILEDMSKVPR